MMKYDLANQAAVPETYSNPPVHNDVRRRKARGISPLFIAAVLLITAALCVALLLARARITALRNECDILADSITELEDERARLTIEYENLYTLEEIEDYAVNVLGMVPATRSAG